MIRSSGEKRGFEMILEGSKILASFLSERELMGMKEMS